MSDPSLAYLLRRVGLIEDRIRALVLHRRADDPAPDDPFRGLYLTEEVVDQLLAPAGQAPRPDWAAREAVEVEGRCGTDLPYSRSPPARSSWVSWWRSPSQLSSP